MQPFLKWAGGKRQLIEQFEPYIPTLEGHTYYEPFIGAGAMLFHLQPQNAVINDVNTELFNVYRIIRDNVDELIQDLNTHENDSEYFYNIRALDRNAEYQNLSDVRKVSRFIYLNKTCFNGLYRVNSKGEFNVPFGKYVNPNIVNEDLLREVSQYLNNNNIVLLNGDFSEAVRDAQRGDIVYLDPPYHPVSETSSFTSYSQDGFGREDQFRLRDLFRDLNERGCKVMLSNSDTPFIRDIYQEFNIITVQATRSINANAQRRGRINEVLVVGDYYNNN